MNVFNGGTDTGKTTLLQTVRDVIPDYSVTIPIEVLMTKERDSSIEESLFSLRGKRFAMTSETGRHYTLNVARLKQLTQGIDSVISVVPKYKPQVTFTATHHLFMDCNFRPRVWGGDDATWRRLRIINCPHHIPKDQQNKHMKEDLLKERQGIIAWLVQGYVEYRAAGGLPTIDDMERRLKGWRNESEQLRDFLDTHCWLEAEWTGKDDDGKPIEPPKVWALAQNELWKRYNGWVALQDEEKRMKKYDFYGDIECLPGIKRGRPKIGEKQTDGFFGIVLKVEK